MVSHTAEPTQDGWFSAEGPEYATVVSSRVRLARNLSSYPFPHRMTESQRLEMRRAVEQVLQEAEDRFVVLDAATMHAPTLAFYRGRGLLPHEEPEAVSYLHEDNAVVVQLSRQDHLRINAFAGGLDLAGAAQGARRVDHILEAQLPYAVSMRLGYLSPSIDHAGTGLSASVMLHLPALSHSEERATLGEQFASGEWERITVRRFGTEDRSTAALHVFSCRASLGETEEETLSVLERFATRLLHYERDAREQLRERHGEELAEAAARAYGTLLHARRLGVDEALELLSVLRLSVVSGQMDQVAAGDCTRLLFLIQDSQVEALKPDDSASLEARRADLVRSVLRSSNV